MVKYNNGDFVMFRKFHSQWGHVSGDYHYGMITNNSHTKYGPDGYSRIRYDICCTDGTKMSIKESRIIVLAKSKKEN
jgi:hypothetical protein|tara:strand:- start:1645 stop:1875 length:231 start_codon:yes stop_codon:yes gene_type:complete